MSHRPFTAEDLAAVHGLLPYTGQVLVGLLGPAAVDLINKLGGCEVPIPKRPDAPRWAELAAIIGDDGMRALAERYGGDIIAIPICRDARAELRARAIRAEFDRLTAGGKMSGRQATYEIVLKFAPITSRAVELACGRPDALGETRQESLF